MLLAHKPHPLPIMSPNIAHRRHPSAPPAVVVQATKTPGLLFVSKQPSRASTPRNPPQQPQSHPHKQFRSPKPKGRTSQPQILEAHLSDDSAKPVVQKVSSNVPAAVEKKLVHPATPTPDKSSRGRQSKTPKDKATTRSSSSQAQARRNNIRQPSPPILSQVEGTTSSLTQSRNNNPASNSFDPFVVSSDSDSDNRSRTNMPFTAKNSSTPPPQGGKAAARRRRPQITTPTPATRMVPVPRSNVPFNRPSISRSAPSQSPAPLRAARRASTICATDFPICDDTTDVDDDTSSSQSSPIREKSATWQQLVSEQGPRTAPLNATAGFPFTGNSNFNTPSPPRRHYRTPSDGVFNMSFDEDMMSTSDTSEEQKKLFGLMPRKHGSVGPSVTRAGKDKTGFFASSVFQNSPSPDELPPPPF